MKASDVMVSNVITVKPTDTVAEVAGLLLGKQISGAPVVDGAGKLVGIVSEGDLLHRVETGTETHRSWWLELLTTNDVRASDFVRSHSNKIADVMTRRVVTAEPDTPLAEIAGVMEKNCIKRVPIVKDGKLVGIVSRANILQALATMAKKVPAGAAIDDATLRNKIVAQLDAEAWSRPALVNVIVHDGAVNLWGLVDSEAEKKAVRVVAETMPGVRTVNDNLVVRPINTAS